MRHFKAPLMRVEQRANVLFGLPQFPLRRTRWRLEILGNRAQKIVTARKNSEFVQLVADISTSIPIITQW